MITRVTRTLMVAALVVVGVGAAGCKGRREAKAPAEEAGRVDDGPQPELVIQVGPNHLVTDVQFSPDGRFLAVTSVDGLLKVFDVRVGKLWRTYLGAVGPLYAASWSPDARTIAAVGLDKAVRIWDVASGAELATMPGHSFWVDFVEYSPDGRHIASACRGVDQVVAIWDVEKKAVRHPLPHTKDIKDLAWSRDGKWLLTATDEVSVWNAETGGLLGTIAIDPNGKGGKRMRFSPDGKLLAIDAADGVHLYDPASWGEVGKVAGALMGWEPDGSLLVHRGDEVARIDPRNGRPLGGFKDQSLPQAVLGPDGRLLAAIDQMHVRLYDGATGTPVRTIESTFWKHVGGSFGNAVDLLHVAWSPTAPMIATAGYDGVLRVLDLRRGTAPKSVFAGFKVEPKRREENTKFHGWTYAKIGLVTDVEFTRDGRNVLTMDGLGVSVWEPNTLTLVRRFAVEGPSALAFAPDGKTLAIAHGDSVISVFDFASGALLRSSKGGALGADCYKGKTQFIGRVWIDGLGWSADASKIYATYGASATFVELDAQTFEPGKGGCAHINAINAVAFTRAGDKMAIGAGLHYTAQMSGELSWGDNSINVFALSGDMPRLHRFEGHTLAVLGTDFSPDGNLLATGSADRTVRLWDVRSGAAAGTLEGHGAEVDSVAFSHDGKYLATASYDLTLKVWDVANKAEVATVVMLGPDGHVIMTPDNYYTASRTGFESVSFRLGETVVPVELFDLRLNRPDLVLSRFGYAPPDLIELYEKAYRKRLKKMRIEEAALRPEYHLPTTTIASDVPITTRERQLPLRVVADDERYRLDRLHVYVNDVPIHGSAGLDLRREKTKHHERTLDIELLPGRNKIQVATLNATGVESLKGTVEVVSTAPARPSDLYVVSVGVSKYADPRLNLKYAAKDARDIAGLFKDRGKRFAKVEVIEILDDDALRENILAARQKLAGTKIDDQVVVFVAGHGMLDKNLDYYFVTHDFDGDKPAKRGLSYEQLESLLDGIPARRKLMMMDTCHSGEVDDEATRVPPPAPGGDGSRGAEGVKVVSDFRTFSYSGAIKTPDRSHEVLAQLFADLRRGSGAAVISSASGLELAQEGAQWGNGVFTYSVLNGLMSGEADEDGDGTISVSELHEYVVHEVHVLTRGAQTPTARRENLDFDFPVL